MEKVDEAGKQPRVFGAARERDEKINRSNSRSEQIRETSCYSGNIFHMRFWAKPSLSILAPGESMTCPAAHLQAPGDGRIEVKVGDVYGSESTVVRELH